MWIQGALRPASRSGALVVGCERPAGPSLGADGGPTVSGETASRTEIAALPAAPKPCPDDTHLVPAGEYPLAFARHHTIGRPLCVDVHEVTARAYRACVATGTCTAPAGGPGCTFAMSGRDEHPVNCVTLEQAEHFCRWAGKRLPTENEWEAAARGKMGAESALAGGDALDRDPRYCVNMGPSEETCAVNDTPEEGGHALRGLTGNVQEWTSSRFCSTSPQCDDVFVVRGGAGHSFKEFQVRYGERSERSRKNPGHGVGFRCASEP
jgi:formylglycine-generating enzyme required for sulfatase activity